LRACRGSVVFAQFANHDRAGKKNIPAPTCAVAGRQTGVHGSDGAVTGSVVCFRACAGRAGHKQRRGSHNKQTPFSCTHLHFAFRVPPWRLSHAHPAHNTSPHTPLPTTPWRTRALTAPPLPALRRPRSAFFRCLLRWGGVVRSACFSIDAPVSSESAACGGQWGPRPRPLGLPARACAYVHESSHPPPVLWSGRQGRVRRVGASTCTLRHTMVARRARFGFPPARPSPAPPLATRRHAPLGLGHALG